MRFPLPAPEPSTSARWMSAAFHDELARWCAEQLGAAVRLENVKQRSWSTVWRVHADGAVFYAKQNCPGQSFEAELVSRLAEWAPDHVVAPTAVDLDTGFLLTPDAGAVLGDHAPSDEALWVSVVSQWAQLQREVVGRVEGLETLTVMRPQDAEEYVADRVDALARFPESDPRHLGAQVASRVHAHLPVVRGWAEEVAALGLPLTLNHNDLHAWNVFAPAGGGPLRFFDLGDAVVAEPLSALLIPLRALEGDDVPAPPSALAALVDAFVEVWSDVATPTQLRRVLPAALQLAKLVKLESWVRCSVAMNPAELAEWGDSLPYWLESLLEDPPGVTRAG